MGMPDNNQLPSIKELLERYRLKKELYDAFEKKESGLIMNKKYSEINKFIRNNIEMLELPDRVRVQKFYDQIIFSGVATLLIPQSFYLMLTRIKFFQFPSYLIKYLRIIYLGFPPALFVAYNSSSYFQLSMYLNDKYFERIENYKITGDNLIINPYLLEEKKITK